VKRTVDMTEITNLLDVIRQIRLHNLFTTDDIPWGRDNTARVAMVTTTTKNDTCLR
jgi:hypothetical protein